MTDRLHIQGFECASIDYTAEEISEQISDALATRAISWSPSGLDASVRRFLSDGLPIMVQLDGMQEFGLVTFMDSTILSTTYVTRTRVQRGSMNNLHTLQQQVSMNMVPVRPGYNDGTGRVMMVARGATGVDSTDAAKLKVLIDGLVLLLGFQEFYVTREFLLHRLSGRKKMSPDHAKEYYFKIYVRSEAVATEKRRSLLGKTHLNNQGWLRWSDFGFELVMSALGNDIYAGLTAEPLIFTPPGSPFSFDLWISMDVVTGAPSCMFPSWGVTRKLCATQLSIHGGLSIRDVAGWVHRKVAHLSQHIASIYYDEVIITKTHWKHHSRPEVPAVIIVWKSDFVDVDFQLNNLMGMHRGVEVNKVDLLPGTWAQGSWAAMTRGNMVTYLAAFRESPSHANAKGLRPTEEFMMMATEGNFALVPHNLLESVVSSSPALTAGSGPPPPAPGSSRAQKKAADTGSSPMSSLTTNSSRQPTTLPGEGFSRDDLMHCMSETLAPLIALLSVQLPKQHRQQQPTQRGAYSQTPSPIAPRGTVGGGGRQHPYASAVAQPRPLPPPAQSVHHPGSLRIIGAVGDDTRIKELRDEVGTQMAQMEARSEARLHDAMNAMRVFITASLSQAAPPTNTGAMPPPPPNMRNHD